MPTLEPFTTNCRAGYSRRSDCRLERGCVVVILVAGDTVVVVCCLTVTLSTAMFPATLDAMPPPLTDAVLVRNSGALLDTFTVRVIGDSCSARSTFVLCKSPWRLCRPARASHCGSYQGCGRRSVTTTVPLVAFPPMLETVIENCHRYRPV